MLFGCFWYLAIKKGQNSLKLFAISITLILIAIVVVVNFFIANNKILLIGIAVSIIQGVIIWNWSIFAPGVVEKFRFKK